MTRRKVLKGVLGNFLGTYVSRYSDYRGYLLFGFLVRDLRTLEFGLLEENRDEPESAIREAKRQAKMTFMEQLSKAGFRRQHVSDARLTIERLGSDTEQGHEARRGYDVRFLACVTADSGQRYQKDIIAFIAPHDPTIERRRHATLYGRERTP